MGKMLETFGEKLAEEVSTDMPLQHRIGAGIARVVVGAIAGAFAVWVYKEGFDLNEKDDEDLDDIPV